MPDLIELLEGAVQTPTPVPDPAVLRRRAQDRRRRRRTRRGAAVVAGCVAAVGLWLALPESGQQAATTGPPPTQAVDLSGLPLADSPVADFGPTRIEVNDDVTLTASSADGRVSLRFEHRDQPGAASFQGAAEATAEPPVVSAGTSNDEAGSVYNYLFGYTRADVDRLEVTFESAEPSAADTLAIPDVPAIRVFAIKLPPRSLQTGEPTFVAQLRDGTRSDPYQP